MIRLEKIGYAYNGVSALENVSFEIEKGEKIVLMGVNGSGKSTLLKLLDGLIFPNKGNYYYRGELITKRKTGSKPFNLSCGEKKKVALASLLIIDPEVIILDEPFSYLDPQSTEWMVNFLTKLDKTLIVSVHNLKIASLISNRLLVLSDTHRLIYDGALEIFSASEEKQKTAGMFTTLNLQ